MKRLLAIAAAGLLAGAAAELALVEAEPRCASHAMLDQGTLRGDGVFLAVATSGCAEGHTCAIADATKPIAREIVPRGVVQDCVAFNQYIGAGLNAIPGYLTGECFAYADVDGRRLQPRRRCAPR